MVEWGFTKNVIVNVRIVVVWNPQSFSFELIQSDNMSFFFLSFRYIYSEKK